MTEQSLAQHTRTYTDEDTRRSRGVAIAVNHKDEIRRFLPGCYTVPASKKSECYLVTVWPASQCNCPDQQLRLKGTGEACKHIHAVRYLLKKSFATSLSTLPRMSAAEGTLGLFGILIIAVGICTEAKSTTAASVMALAAAATFGTLFSSAYSLPLRLGYSTAEMTPEATRNYKPSQALASS